MGSNATAATRYVNPRQLTTARLCDGWLRTAEHLSDENSLVRSW